MDLFKIIFTLFASSTHKFENFLLCAGNSKPLLESFYLLNALITRPFT